MKTDKELADELDAADRLEARGYQKKKCKACGGLGRFFKSHFDDLIPYPCPSCYGKGYQWLAPILKRSKA